MRISIIAAVAENGVIGRGGRLPWHLSDDLRRFKRLTMGHTIVMGRRTWESIDRALPGRRMVVVSRQPHYHVDAEGVLVAASLDDAIQIAAAARDEEVFIVGGAEIYHEALPQSDRIYLTRVSADIPGDTYFPEVPWSEWHLIESEQHRADDKNDYAFVFQTWQPATSLSQAT